MSQALVNYPLASEVCNRDRIVPFLELDLLGRSQMNLSDNLAAFLQQTKANSNELVRPYFGSILNHFVV